MALPLIGAVASVSMFDLKTMAVEQEASFVVDRPGPWVLASETRSVLDGAAHLSEAVALADVTLVDPEGADVEVGVPPRGVRYETPDRSGVIIGSFEASTPGAWTLVRREPAVPAVLMAVGPDPASAAVWWLLIPGGLAVVLLGAAGGCGWVAFRAARRAAG
ncbi:MAG: hypothetical protein QF733_01250 [Phycisphaerales bacterium]|jgi:hypothetical protein|nr:hypothetical protein [Phycisphaerales bacterium]